MLNGKIESGRECKCSNYERAHFYCLSCFFSLWVRVLYNVPACQDTKLKNLSYILLPFLSAYAAIRYC